MHHIEGNSTFRTTVIRNLTTPTPAMLFWRTIFNEAPTRPETLATMNPSKVIRERVTQLTDLPNIGKAVAADLVLLGITEPAQLIGMCPYEMYERLCSYTKFTHDPCLLDTFISITRFMNGEAPQPWWHFTSERKQRLSGVQP